MIVYSASPDQALVVEPGERLVYGDSEHLLQGFGEVHLCSTGQLVVNGQTVNSVIRRYVYVRKLGYSQNRS